MGEPHARPPNSGLGAADFTGWVPVGRVISVQPGRSRVRVRPHDESFPGLEDLESFAVKEGEGYRKFSVGSTDRAGTAVVLSLVNCPPDDVAALKGKEILVPGGEERPLEEDEYYWQDLIGLRVVDTEGKDLGEIRQIYQTGANDIYEVVNEAGAEILVPAIRSVIKNIDTERRVMTIDAKLLEVAEDED